MTWSAPGCGEVSLARRPSPTSKPRRVLNEEKVLAEHPEPRQVGAGPRSADAALGKALDDYREPLGARTLTVRREKETT